MAQLYALLKNQKRIALANCGLINPESIEEYIAQNGYFALEKVITGMEPAQVIEEIKKSGLRGRGGGGFPTGLKWEFAAKSSGDTKYVICNGDEGDPGAFMDRSILEGDPHAVIEGMAIAGYAIGAEKGYFYVRAEYPIAVARLKKAIQDAKNLGLIGKNIFRSGFHFDLEIRLGAGAFVCGEETALMASIEGKRGEPRPKPPFPAQSGLWGKPTIINNVETLANVPAIIRNGSKWFSSIGTEKSKGTKVFALAGKIINNGLVEVPMGTNLGEVIFDVGGGVPGGKKFKAAQTGGPSGGCIPAEHLNVPIDYESLSALGTIMGSGGLIIMDEDTCMVDLAKFFLDFIKDESCGKCTACRSGTVRMLDILDRITKGEGQEGDIELLIELGQSIKDSALCGLGQSAPNPVLSTIRYFRHEYEEHIKDKYCRASVCATMFHSSCHNSCPADIDIPIYVDLIRQRKYLDAYRFIKRDNPLPLICGRVCNHPCESKCNRSKIDDAIAIRNLKRFAADFAFSQGVLEETVPVVKKNVKVAIVGSGPAGLTCAYYLAKKGYQVTVFEEQGVVGGMLATVIPEYRLPKARLQAEIDTIKAVGVEIRTNCGIGEEKDIRLEQLKEDGYQAIFIAVGTHLELRLNQPGEDLDGVVSGITFLRNINLGPVPNLSGKTVAVIGGGNVAIDAARCALRVGAKDVNIIYRRSREDMPALAEEIREAESEGIHIHSFVNSKQVVGENGKVKALECMRMRRGNFDVSGRRKSLPVEGSEFLMPVDVVIVAVGQTLKRGFLKGTGVQVIEPGMIGVAPKTYLTSVEGIFAAGDCISGPSTVVEAIKGGKEAAANIDRYLGGDGKVIPKIEVERKLSGEILEKEQPRHPMNCLPVNQRLSGFAEVELGYAEDEAIKEACRCLRCDVKK
ncbi:NADH-quinone oxidoreductase subunit NuoF [Candidatus Formimonas warabiya]|uniref:Hydrogenase n=1 Tax=Formimonas warabiya TaxID=1761012 RepID=A0A3G1KQE7_FORW1|nr:NADH-quinone oxidoreductase subunit NuoF [Candidatus Formimonas warabiya]ATW24668.1 hydrogenase [Candidatus Formimonas warabiya]